METQETDLSNEAAALADILKWSADLPAWQRDALRRLCSQPKLESADITALVAVCKAIDQAAPLDASHIRDPAGSHAVVSLGALHGLSNVNALAPGERLSFGKTGLTVIYGDNGAGKSGYARVLKQLCRARSPKDDAILPNIYAAGSGTPTASVDFFIGGQKRSASWIQGSAPDPMLSAVSVFDSRTANVHVENTNDLAYTPLPLRILAGLAQACQDVKAKLAVEIKALQEQTPAILSKPECKPDTPVGKLIAGLSGKTKEEGVEKLAGLTAEEETRLQTLNTDLASDPARTVRQLQSQEARIKSAIEQIERLMVAATDETRAALRDAHTHLATARSAAAAASANLFAEEPLPDIGSDVWKILWEAARDYSRASAYPDRPFPVAGTGAHCVLCQQPLGEEASKRLNSFEAFVQDESKRREQEAVDAYDEKLDEVSSQAISMKDLAAIIATIRDDIGQEEVASTLRREILHLTWRLRAILRTHGYAALSDLPSPATISLDPLRTALNGIATRIEGLQSEASSPQRVALVAERDGLADRKWLGVVKADVLAQIDRLKAVEAIEKASKDTATNKITTQSAHIAQALVTNRLRGRFAIEVNKLGVAGLAIELQQAKTTAGVPFFQVRLINKPNEPVGKVLSEGEHRCVALAAFLAELSTIDAQSAIVFDDPVSSLDHLHRDKVAARLAEAGQTRQVIVFTHDMAFLLLLDEACRATKDREATPVAYRLISRGPENAGYCHQDPPANVMPLDKVIDGMKAHLANVKIHHERGDQAKWLREVTSFQDQLRTTWERAVEEVVGPVIRRLSRKVDTTGLIKLTVLTDTDCTAMREAFGRCSALLHSQPGEINPRLPAPSAIEAEIEALAQWVADIRTRQDKAA
ncbi:MULTISPECIES: AAA family ATPase [Bradyrhizobium]|jgi:energy-coupling factor transporter ATP-binding protein EcfA2|uniref:AAA family ATPase n=3 Tax=Nitrobacteraceae TaxID=41294 RepID=UPI0020235A56|nr:AAA family ATPase [Bradyrhizobium denitrificans]MCL8484371.1 AAA family ATPase [Bradyrhizobium denitrificans]